MYSPHKNNEDDIFANLSYNKNIECISQTTELAVTVRANGIQAQKLCLLYAEKMDFKGIIQLRLTEKSDQRRMYITTVDSASFHELKQDQSLHVSFSGFIEHLVRLLEDCQNGKLELHLVQQQRSPLSTLNGTLENITHNTDNYQLQFVEMRPFKNLVHLCLPSRLAPLNVVLFYINSILDVMQKSVSVQEVEKKQLQHELRAQLIRIEQLEKENSKLHENLLENTRNQNQQHAEEMQQLKNSLQALKEQKHNDNERNRNTISSLKTQLEQMNIEKSNILAEKTHEQKRKESLNAELNSVTALLATVREQNDKFQQEITSLKNHERRHELHLTDARKHILELQEKLRKHEKSKDDMLAELEAEKKITHTKRQALEIATEEISKANEIILKQTMELKKLKKTIDWRTEVAIRQEKAINEKDKLLLMRDDEIKHLESTIHEMRLEIPKQLDAMRKFATSLEKKYTEQINALREKLKCMNMENIAPEEQLNLWATQKHN